MMWSPPLVVMLAVLGHLGLTFLVINVSHGSGWLSPWLDRLTILLLAVAGLSSLAAIGWLWGVPFSRWPLPLQSYGAVCLAISLIGLPVACVKRYLRRNPPTGTTVRHEEFDFSRPDDEGRTPFGAGLRSWMLRLPGNESLRLRILDYNVELPGLAPELDGLSVLQLSDFHFTLGFQRTFFEAVAREAARRPADLVLFTGDLVDDQECIAWIEPVLGQVRGRLGSFAILGNHDCLAGPSQIEDELRRTGYEMLEGRWTTRDYRGVSLCLGGTSAPWGSDPDPTARPPAALSILLCHTPDGVYRAASWGVDLMFSGHNHGGQVRLPIIGPILMPSVYGRRFDCGFFRQDRTLLYVSRGLGAEYPIRYGCPPEITRLTFRSAGLQVDPAPRVGTNAATLPTLAESAGTPRMERRREDVSFWRPPSRAWSP